MLTMGLLHHHPVVFGTRSLLPSSSIQLLSTYQQTSYGYPLTSHQSLTCDDRLHSFSYNFLLILEPTKTFSWPMDVTMLTRIFVYNLSNSQNRVVARPKEMFHILVNHLSGGIIAVYSNLYHSIFKPIGVYSATVKP